MISSYPQIILTRALKKRLRNLPSNTQKMTHTASSDFQQSQWIGELFSNKQLLLIFLKIYDCQRFGEVRNADMKRAHHGRYRKKTVTQSAWRCFIKNGQWRKRGIKHYLLFVIMGIYVSKMFHLIPSLLTTGNCIYKEKQPEELLTRKGSRHQRNSMEASQRRAQNRNQSLKALERIVYSRGKIGT